MTTAKVYQGDIYSITVNRIGPAKVSCWINEGELVEVRQTASSDEPGEVYVRLLHGTMVKRDPMWRSTREEAAADIADRLRRVVGDINEKILELTLEEVGV